jgi:hypothetical protein
LKVQQIGDHTKIQPQQKTKTSIAFPMAYVKFKPNFGLKSYFFYFVQSLFNTPSIRFSISNSILFKYYFFINFLLLFSIQLKPNKHPKKTHSNFINRAQQLQEKKKRTANLQTFAAILQKIIASVQTFTVILQKIIKTKTTPAHQSKITHNTITITDLKNKKKQQKKQKKKGKREMAASERLKESEKGKKWDGK